MRVRTSEDFRVAYKRLKERHKSLQQDFEKLLSSLLQNPMQGVMVVLVRFGWPSHRKVEAKVVGQELLSVCAL